jgi:hypothetical protein
LGFRVGAFAAWFAGFGWLTWFGGVLGEGEDWGEEEGENECFHGC